MKNERLMNLFKNNGHNYSSPLVKSIERCSAVTIVKLVGAVDFNTMPPIENDMKVYQKYMDQDVVLDFKEVTHIDTSTLAVLIYIISKLKQRQKKLSLINCSNMIREYIKIGKLEPIIHVYDTLEGVLKETSK